MPDLTFERSPSLSESSTPSPACQPNDASEDRLLRLRESEQRARRLAQVAFEGIAISQDGIVLDVNSALAELFGYETPEDMSGVAAESLAALSSRSVVLGKIASGDETPYEALLLRRDGSAFEAEVRGRGIEIDGRPARVTAVRDLTEQKKAERALRESEARLSEAQAVARVGSWSWDLATGRLDWSDETFRLFGMDPRQGPPTFEEIMALVHPEDAAALSAAIKACAQDGTPYGLDVRLGQLDGGYRWAHAIGQGSEDSQGLVVRLFGTLMDVHERREAELDRQRSEERFRTLFESSSDAHLIFDEGGILACNPAAVALLRCKDASDLMAIHPAVLSPVLQPDGRRSDEKCVEMDRLARENGVHRFEWTHRKSDCEEFPVEVTLTHVELDGRSALLTVWHDLTQIRAAERAVRASEADMAEAQRTAGIGSWSWEVGTGRIAWSAQLFRLFGIDPAAGEPAYAEMMAKHHPADVATLQAAVDRCVADGDPYEVDLRVRQSDGSFRWTRAVGRAERGASGSVERLSGTLMDVHERKEAELALGLAEDRFRKLFEHSSDPHLLYGARGFYGCNEAAVRILGFPSKEAVRDLPPAEVSPEFQPCGARSDVKAPQMAALAFQNGVHVFEWTHRKADGTEFPVEVTASAVDLGGEPALLIVWHDLTQIKVNERRLKESARQLAEAQAVASVGSWRRDFASRTCEWSNEMFRLFGMAVGDAPLGREEKLARFHPEDVPALAAAFDACERIGAPYDLVARLSQRVGSHLWVRVIGRAEPGRDGRPAAMRGTITDVHRLRLVEDELRRSEAALQALLGAAPVVLFAADARGTIVESKGSGLSALGLQPGQAVGRSMFDFNPDPESAAAIRRALTGQRVRFETWHGEVCLMKEVRPVHDDAGVQTGLIGVAVDVTERRRAEDRLAESQRRLSLATEAAESGVWELDVVGGRLSWDARMHELFGVPQVMGQDLIAAFTSALHPDDRERTVARGWASAREGVVYDDEFRVVLPSGELRHLESHAMPTRGEDGSVARLVGINWDVTARREAELSVKAHAAQLGAVNDELAASQILLDQRLAEVAEMNIELEAQRFALERANERLSALATTDGLTGLHNHRSFQERLEGEIARARRTGEPLSIALLDVDRFKAFNDEHGHQAGDAVLRAVAAALGDTARQIDMVARYGGEEFVLILPGACAEDAFEAAERHRRAIEAIRLSFGGVTASFGVATLSAAMDQESLIEAADAAMYQSKQGGRNRTTSSSPRAAS